MENGCQGGQLGGAWNYAKKTGLVEEACFPYLKSEGGPVRVGGGSVGGAYAWVGAWGRTYGCGSVGAYVWVVGAWWRGGVLVMLVGG